MGASLSRPLFLAAGTLYPGYGTFKALESRRVADVKQWLAYWIVHSAISGGEFFAGGAVRSVVPLYNFAKLLAIIWLVHPQYRGALYCYNSFVRPYLLKHQNEIDETIQKASDAVAERTRAVSESALKWLEEKKKETVLYVRKELKKAAVETISGQDAETKPNKESSSTVSHDTIEISGPRQGRNANSDGTTVESVPK